MVSLKHGRASTSVLLGAGICLVKDAHGFQIPRVAGDDRNTNV